MLNTVSGLLWWKRELRLFQVGILFQTGFIHHRLSRSTRPSQSHCHSQSRPKLGRSRAVPGNFLDGRPIASTDRGRGRGCKLLRRENTGRANDNSSIIFQLPRPHVKHHLQLTSAPGMCEKGEREKERERERERGEVIFCFQCVPAETAKTKNRSESAHPRKAMIFGCKME